LKAIGEATEKAGALAARTMPTTPSRSQPNCQAKVLDIRPRPNLSAARNYRCGLLQVAHSSRRTNLATSITTLKFELIMIIIGAANTGAEPRP
jgi:hypothetical protein